MHDLLTEISQEADMRNCFARDGRLGLKKTPKSVGGLYVGFGSIAPQTPWHKQLRDPHNFPKA